MLGRRFAVPSPKLKRAELWQKFVTELFQDLGYEIQGAGSLPDTLLVNEPAPGIGGPPEVCRWLVLCRVGPRAPVLSAADLNSGISEAEAQGVMGFDLPESSADQKQQIEALPASVARQSINPPQFVRDNVRDPERKELFLNNYQNYKKAEVLILFFYPYRNQISVLS